MTGSCTYLYGYYGCGNLGDDLLLGAVISRLRTINPVEQFVVRAYGPVEVFANDKLIEYSCAEAILSDQNSSKLVRIARYYRHHFPIFRKCSRMIFGGGTLFHARDGALGNLIVIAGLVLLARLFGVQIYALGVGVASLPSAMSRLLMSLIVAVSDDFVVRDSGSMANCQQLIFRSALRRGEDLVFGLPFSCAKNCRPASNKVLGLTLAASDIAGCIERYPNFPGELEIFISALQNEGWKVIFMSCQEFTNEATNLSDSALFIDMIGKTSGVVVMRLSANAAELCDQLADVSIVMGMRFHGLVASAILGKPFVGFGRDQKLKDLCEEFSMPFTNLDMFSAHQVCEFIRSVAERIPSQDLVAKKRKAAQENFCRILRAA